MTLLVVLLTCDPALLAQASARASEFDLRGAIGILRAANDCADAAGAVEYLEGLAGAPHAFDSGGTDESLRELRSAANALAQRAEGGDRRWQAASLALRAVIAASQQERAETSLYLSEAIRIEGLLLAGKLPGAPLVTVHELAGDLLLRLHQFADARAAYLRAGSVVGYAPRVRFGLARTAERLDDVPGACGEYRALLEWWNDSARQATPPEITDARARIQALGCLRAGRPRRP